MVYMVIFNRKYRRQFEAVVSKEDWQHYKSRYGAGMAVAILIAGLHRVKDRGRKTRKREESYRHFILNMFYRPDVFGTPIVKVGKTKAEVLHKGHSEFVITSKKGMPHARRPAYPR